MGHKTKTSGSTLVAVQTLGPVLGAVLFFFAVCLCSAATVRSMAMLLILLALSTAFLFWERLRDRLKPPILALALMVLMDILSCAYATSRKFALFESLKVIASFCLVLLFLSLAGGEKPERKVAAVLEGCAAIAGLTSIDLLSTRWISTPVLTVLGWFTSDYVELEVVEEGIRMISVFMYANTFACCMGIGILMGLGLAITAKKRGERIAHIVCLSVNSLAFILSFSMGACASMLPAFLIFLLLVKKEQRSSLFLLMVETLLVTMLCAFPISMTSMTAWTGFRPIPLLCTVCGATVLCGLDLLVEGRLAAKLEVSGKTAFALIAAILVGGIIFAIAACNLTTGTVLQAGKLLRRSTYPKPGTYTVSATADSDPTVTIQSQNRADTIRHTYSELYQGPLSQAAFTVPEDSTVVWFQFSVEEETWLSTVEYSGENGSGNVPLGYRLLPGFIANRIQGLRTNQNAIQRFAFFEDGLKLFRRSPVVGLGLGSFANSVQSVQSFYYYTKYAHSHYIQTLVETGIIGFALFLGLLIISAVSICWNRKMPMAPALSSALVFIAGHSALDGIFSNYASMPIVFGAFAVINLCCGDTLSTPAWAEKKSVKNGLMLGICALLAVFGVLLGCNSAAANMVNASPDLPTLERAAALDPFEGADYMLTYVVKVTRTAPEDEIRQKADKYAARLEKLDSNIIPYYLAEYYLDSRRTERGLEMAERYVTYVASDLVTWQNTFELLELYEQNTPEYRAAVVHIADLLDAWNEENLGYIELDEQYRLFIERMRT